MRPEKDDINKPLHEQIPEIEYFDLDGWHVPKSEIRSKSKADLALEYDKSSKTIKKWLQLADVITGNRTELMPAEVMKFYRHAGPNERFAPVRNKRKELKK